MSEKAVKGFPFTLISVTLLSCEFKPQSKSYKPESQELRACLSSTKHKAHKKFTDASLVLIKQYDAKIGYIPLLLEQRRKMELLCNNVAECYKNEEPKKVLNLKNV